MAPTIDWGAIQKRSEDLKSSWSRSEFLTVDAGKSVQFRLEQFEPEPGVGKIDLEVGTHFGLECFGATESRYNKDTKTYQVAAVSAAKCPAITIHQHRNPQLAALLDELRRDHDRLCADAEIDLLDQHCLFCGLWARLKRSGDDVDRVQARNIEASRKYLLNGVHRSELKPNGVWAIFEAPPGVYRDITALLMSGDYRGKFLGDPAREFMISAEARAGGGGRFKGKGKDYAVRPTADDYYLGKPEGKPTNLLDPGWLSNVQFCWNLEQQREIIEGRQVQKPKKEEEDSAAPKPRCYDRGMKDMSQPVCTACPFARTCDDPNAKRVEAEAPKTDPKAAANRMRSLLSGIRMPTAPPAVPPAAVNAAPPAVAPAVGIVVPQPAAVVQATHVSPFPPPVVIPKPAAIVAPPVVVATSEPVEEPRPVVEVPPVVVAPPPAAVVAPPVTVVAPPVAVVPPPAVTPAAAPGGSMLERLQAARAAKKSK